jgi:hypothetical protein
MKIESSLALAALLALSTSFVDGAEDIKTNIRGGVDAHRSLSETHVSRPASGSGVVVATGSIPSTSSSRTSNNDNDMAPQSVSASIVAASRASHGVAAAAGTTTADTVTRPQAAQTTVKTAGTASSCNDLFVKLKMYTDSGANDMKITIEDDNGQEYWKHLENLEEDTLYELDDCFYSGECYTFTIEDSSGDGFSNGSYMKLWIDYGSGMERIMNVQDSIDFSKKSRRFGDNC